MRSLTLEILWTKKGDGQPHQRKRVVSVEVPVEGGTSAIQDALLSLPWTEGVTYGESWMVRLVEPREALGEKTVLDVAIPQARAEMEERERREAEQEKAGRTRRIADRVVELETFVNGGDPGGVSGLLICGGIKNSVTSETSLCSLADREEVEIALEGCDDLRAKIEARIIEANAGIEKTNAQIRARAVEYRAEQEARDAAKQAKVDARATEIAQWAAEHGGTRLQTQLDQGLSGWPLYLHERLAADWACIKVEVELDNDGETGNALINPADAQLWLAARVADRVVELGLCADEKAAFASIAIVPIDLETSDEYDQRRYGGDYDGDSPEKKVYVTFDGYRPGSGCFATKTIRFCCEE